MKTFFRINNNLNGLDTLCDRLHQLKVEWSLPKKIVTEINLVLDELITNTIKYGDCCNNQPIEITITKTGQHLTIKIIDKGRPFDPTLCQLPDTSLPLEERRCGGLGILLVRRLCTKWNYNRLEDKNILTLLINLPKEHR